MGIECIIIDFGNVIGFFDRSKAAAQLAKISDLGPDLILQYLQTHPSERAFELGQLNSLDQLKNLRNECHLMGSSKEIIRAYADMFAPNEEIIDLIPRLKPAYRLGLLSNTNALHFDQLLQQFPDTLACFDFHVLSFEVGYRKPQSEIYQHALLKTGCPADQCLLIDDLSENIDSARYQGIQGLLYQPANNLVQALECRGVALKPFAERIP